MLGHRGKTDQEQWDAFSRRARALLHWRPGDLKRIKRRFAKQMRREGRVRCQEEQ